MPREQGQKVVAQNLIDYDKQWSSLMAKKSAELADPTEEDIVRAIEGLE